MKLLEAAVEASGPIFTLNQVKTLDGSKNLSATQLRKLMSALASSGWVKILKRGVYAVTSPLFANEITPFALAAALVQPSAISHWSALAHHGFITQLPRVVQASTPRKVVTPEMHKGSAHSPRGRAVWHALDIEVEFIYVQPKRFFGHQKIWVNRWQQVAMTDPERTALDLIARPDVFGGFRAAAEILEGALPQIRPEKLVEYALRYDVGAVMKRLGWLLEQLGVPKELIAPLEAYPVTTYYRLDPQGPARGQADPGWRVLENLRRSMHA